MIRKMLVIAAAVAMPASVLAGVTGAGLAGAAAKPPPSTGTCSVTGSVTFAAPGLSKGGTITNKTVEKSSSTLTPSGFCGIKAVKTKIPSATSACWATLPTYSKTAPVGGTLASGAPTTCDVGGSSAASDATLNPATIKTAIKDKFYYDTAGSLATAGSSSILTAINAKPIKLSNNGNSSSLTATAVNTVLPGGVCGAGGVGFQIVGTDTFAGATHVAIQVCLVGDTGPGTTNVFLTDLAGGTATIATATYGAPSGITYSA